MDHSVLTNTLLTALVCFGVLISIWRSRGGKLPFIRRIAGLNAIDEAVGRATEMGRPILLQPGLGGIDVVTLQALSILCYVARSAAKFGNKIMMPVADSAFLTVAQEAVRDTYSSEDRAEYYDPDSVRFLTDRQFAFASGVAGLINREQVAATFLFGWYFAESLIIAENACQVGAIQVAGTPSTTQLPFLIAACDYVIIGDEFYAASAYLTRDPTLVGSVVGQDYGKIIILVIVVVGIFIGSVLGPHTFWSNWWDALWWTKRMLGGH